MEKVKVEGMSGYRATVMWLMEQGCNPRAHSRGEVKRFHVNKCGNFCADAETLPEACEEVVNNWIEAGMPKEGSSE